MAEKKAVGKSAANKGPAKPTLNTKMNSKNLLANGNKFQDVRDTLFTSKKGKSPKKAGK